MEKTNAHKTLKRFCTIPEVGQHRRCQPYIGILLLLLIPLGWFLFPPLGYVIVGCMLTGIVYGIVKGRYWCDWMCPRGSFWDSYLSKISFNRTVPRFLRHTYWRLFWLFLMMTVVVFLVSLNWGNWYRVGKAPFLMLLTVTTVVGLIVGIRYHSRAWCMFCPIGSMANFLGRGKHVLRIGSQCLGSKCKQCYKVCRMQIHPGDYKETGVVQHGDCLKCSRCIEVCPTAALAWAEQERPLSKDTLRLHPD